MKHSLLSSFLIIFHASAIAVVQASPTGSTHRDLQKRVGGWQGFTHGAEKKDGARAHIKVGYNNWRYHVKASFCEKNPQVVHLALDSGSGQLWAYSKQGSLAQALKDLNKETVDPALSSSIDWRTPDSKPGIPFCRTYGSCLKAEGFVGWDTIELQSIHENEQPENPSSAPTVPPFLRAQKTSFGLVEKLISEKPRPLEWEIEDINASGILSIGFGGVKGYQPSFFQDVSPSLQRPMVSMSLPFRSEGDVRFGYLEDQPEGYDPANLQWSQIIPVGAENELPRWQLTFEPQLDPNAPKEVAGETVTAGALLDTGSAGITLNRKGFESLLLVLKANKIRYKVRDTKIPGSKKNLGIPCNKMNKLKGIKWQFGLGRQHDKPELSFPAYIDLGHIRSSKKLFISTDLEYEDENLREYCQVTAHVWNSKSKLILGLPFFHSNFVAMELDPKNHLHGAIGWAPLKNPKYDLPV